MHKHTEEKKKTRDIINIWMPYANGRERADVVAFNWPICELHPNLSVCFLGPLCTVSTGFLVPHNIWAANVAILAVFKHKGRETQEDSKQWHENGFLGLGFVCRKIVVLFWFLIISLYCQPWWTNYKVELTRSARLFYLFSCIWVKLWVTKHDGRKQTGLSLGQKLRNKNMIKVINSITCGYLGRESAVFVFNYVYVLTTLSHQK